jgi:hypothetical protein
MQRKNHFHIGIKWKVRSWLAYVRMILSLHWGVNISDIISLTLLCADISNAWSPYGGIIILHSITN